MGTSGIYNGPKGTNPLVPDWYQEEENEGGNGGEKENDENDGKEENDENGSNNKDKLIPIGSWQGAKTQMSKYASGSSNHLGSVFKSYLKALGGGKGAAKAAISGKNSAASLGKVMNSISSRGFKETLESYKISFASKSLEEVLSNLASIIAPDGATKEEAVARKATLDSIEYFYDRIEEEGLDINSLDTVNETLLSDVMEKYFSSYIFEKMLCDLESRIENYADNSNKAIEIENQIKNYIDGTIKNELGKVKFLEMDYNSKKSKDFINKVYEDCYNVVEVSI